MHFKRLRKKNDAVILSRLQLHILRYLLYKCIKTFYAYHFCG